MSRIVRVEARLVEERLTSSFRISYSSSEKAKTLWIAIELSDGSTGLGEAAPAYRVTGETIESAKAYIDSIAGRLVGTSLPEGLGEALRVIHRGAPWSPAARSSLEGALLAAASTALGVEETLLLGSSGKPRLETDYTISIPPPPVLQEIAETGYSHSLAEAIEYITGARSRPPSSDAGIPLPRVNGFRVLKVKLGTGDPILDASLAIVVAEAAPKARIRIDANQAWSPKTALRVIHRLEDTLGDQLTLIEQPVPWNTPLDTIKWLRSMTETPLALDETVKTHHDVARAAARGAADVVNIKLAKIGGPLQAVKAAAVAQAHGLETMWGCMVETGVGVAHAAAAAWASGSTAIVDLDAPLFLEKDPGARWAQYERETTGVVLETETPKEAEKPQTPGGLE